MAARHVAACVLALPLVSACAFLLDFDEMQRGNSAASKDGGGGRANGAGGATGTGGNAGTAGTSGTAGATGTDAGHEAGASGGSDSGRGDASQACPTGCADTDPCTVDACTAEGCTHTYAPGVVSDGLSEVVRAPRFHRVTMIAWKNSFYLSALETTATSTDVVFHSFDGNAKGIGTGRLLTTLANFNGRVPVSTAGIAAGSKALALKLFVAMGTALGDPAQVWELTVDPTSGATSGGPAAIDDNYAAAPTVYPATWTPDDTQVWAAWPGATSGVFLHRAAALAEPTGTAPRFGALAGKVTDVAPLAAGATPAVLYINSVPNVQADGQSLPLPLGSCDSRPASFTSAVSASAQVEGIWLGGWTKTLTAGSTLVEFKPVLCGASTGTPGCIGSPKCEATDQIYPGVRNPAILFFNSQNDPPARVYEALASPYVKAGEVGMELQAIQIDFNLSNPDAGDKATAVTTKPVPIVKRAPGSNDTGPDWPALAFLPPDHLGLAWIEPKNTTEQELHVERHKVCFPK